MLYVCMIVVPLSGYTGGGRRRRSRVLKELCSQVHLVTVIVYITLIAIHITAALKHLLVDRDGVF